MKVFLRNRATGLYWAGPDAWAATTEGAFDFFGIPQASRFAREQQFPRMELILKYADLPDEVPVPLLAERPPSNRRAAG
jgi:hypothetical protein